MKNPLNAFMFSDIVAYSHRNKLYCVLCVEEKNIKKQIPVSAYHRVKEKVYCDGCKAELSLKMADWKCTDCNTMNEHFKKQCDGCSNLKNS